MRRLLEKTSLINIKCLLLFSNCSNPHRLLSTVRRFRGNFQKTSIKVFPDKTSREVFYKKSNFWQTSVSCKTNLFIWEDFSKSLLWDFRFFLNKVFWKSSRTDLRKKNDFILWDCEITCFASSLSTQKFTTKATKSLITTNHELQRLYEPYKAWNQNLSFLDEFEERVKNMWFVCIINEIWRVKIITLVH